MGAWPWRRGKGGEGAGGEPRRGGKILRAGKFFEPEQRRLGYFLPKTFPAQSSRDGALVRERSHDGDLKNSRAKRHPRAGER